MDKEFNSTAHFFIPTLTDEKILGSLSYSFTEGIRFSLKIENQSIPQLFNATQSENKKNQWSFGSSSSLPQYDIVNGILENGKYFTLEKVKIFNQDISINHYVKLSGYASRFYIGYPFKSIEDIKFNMIACSLNYLRKFVGISGFKKELNPKNIKGLNFNCEYKTPETIKIKLPDSYDFILKICFSTQNRNDYSYPQEDFGIKEATQLVIKSTNEEKNIEEYKKVLDYFIDLLSFARLKPIYILSLNGYTKHCKFKLGDGKEFEEKIEIYFPIYSKIDTNIQKSHPDDDFIFTLPNLFKNLDKYFSNWFLTLDKFKHIFDLFFSKFYLQIDILSRFLNLTRTIEGLCRAEIKNNSYMDKKKFEKEILPFLKKSIPNNINNNFREKIKQTMNYLNEYSLRKKIKQIFKQDDNFIKSFFKDFKDFISRVVDLRNDLTHLSKKNSFNENNFYQEIIYLTEALELIIILFFLKKIGFEKEEIKTLLNNNYLNNFRNSPYVKKIPTIPLT